MNTPALSSVIPAITIPWPLNYTIMAGTSFTDAEADPILITCTNTTTSTNGPGWLYQTYETTFEQLELFGMPPSSNNYAGTVTFTCNVKDIYDALPNQYTFTLDVQPN